MAQEPRIIALDSQILDAIQKCAFYTFLSFVKNWRSNEGAMPLERGDLGHFMLETYYKLLKLKKYDFDTIVEHVIREAREHYQDYHSTDLQTLEWTIKTFVQYTEFFRYEELEIHAVEEAFSFILYESDELILLYQGKIDLECTMPAIGRTAIDHKWRGMKANYTPLDNQFIGYAVHSGHELIYINEVGMQKSYQPKEKFRRIPINITPGVKNRWKLNTIQWGKILDHYLQNDVWPQSHLKVAPQGVSQCEKCNYNRICNSNSEDEMKIKIESEFHQKPQWDVGKLLEEHEISFE